MEKLLRKFVADIKMNKLNALKYSGVVGFFTFTTTFIYVNMTGAPNDVALVRAAITTLVLFTAVYFMCFRVVNMIDKKDEKVALKKQEELEERRRRLEERNNKVNNKKKKKNKEKV